MSEATRLVYPSEATTPWMPLSSNWTPTTASTSPISRLSADAGAPKVLHQRLSEDEEQVGDQAQHGERGYCQHHPGRITVTGVAQRGGDGAGSDEDRDGQGGDGHVHRRIDVEGVDTVHPRALHCGRIALKHPETHHECDGTAGELERADRDAEEGEDHVPCHAQAGDDHEGDRYRPERDRPAHLIGHVGRHAQEHGVLAIGLEIARKPAKTVTAKPR